MRRRDFIPITAAGVAATSLVSADNAVIDPRSRLTAIHTMVQLPEWSADHGKYWDAKSYVELCRQAGVGIIEMKGKNEMGHAMIPLSGRPCARDWMTPTREAARTAGIGFVAYYNIGLDNWMAKHRPEWCCLDADGKPQIAFGAYPWMCVRSPWRDLVLDEIRQMVSALRPEGLWFDLVGAPNAYAVGSFDPRRACFCPHCRAAYKKAYGEEQPAATDDPALRFRLNRFGHQARVAILRDACNAARAIDPRIWLGSNGAGFFDTLNSTPEDVRRLITFNSSEAKPHREISFKAKSMWALDHPYQVHSYGGFSRMQPGTAIGTWAAWNLIPSSYLETSAAVVAAHNGRLSVGVNPLPNGTFQADEMRNLSAPFAAVKERSSWLAGLRSVPDVAIVYDPSSELVLLPQKGTRGTPIRQEATGLHHALLEAGIHFDVIDTERLQPSKYRALLVGNAIHPKPELLEKLRAWVEAGGFLLVTNETSLCDANAQHLPDFGWSRLLGVRFERMSPSSQANFCWLGEELRGDAPKYPMLFLTPVVEVACTTAQPLAELAYAAAERTPEVYTDGETPYTHFGPRTGKPLITLNRVDRGQVMYIGAPIGMEILQRDDTWLKYTVARAVKKYAAPLIIESETPGGVQVVLGRQDGELGGPKGHVISLVNHYNGLVAAAWGTPRPEVGPIRLRVHLDRLKSNATTVKFIGAKGVEWKIKGPVLDVHIERIGHHAVLLLA